MSELFCWMRDGVRVPLPLTELPSREIMVSALARMLRWRGVWQTPISVARHSVLVGLVTRALGGSKLAGLLHDYHGAITGDKPSPVLKFERLILDTIAGPGAALTPHDELARYIDQLVCEAWNLPQDAFADQHVRRADAIVACAEAAAHGVAPLTEVKKFFGLRLWDETLEVMADDTLSILLRKPWQPEFDSELFLLHLRRCERGVP